MIYDIQNATIGKRLSAWLLDIILLVVLITGVATLVAALTGYDTYSAQLDGIRTQYSKEYGIDIGSDYNSLSKEDQEKYMTAVQAYNNDLETQKLVELTQSLGLTTLSISILASYAILELAVPLFLKNGQTLGKKVFGIALIRKDGVKVTPFIIFARTIVGKCTIGTMIPLMLIFLSMFSSLGMMATLILLALLLVQAILTLATPNKTSIHDLLACTVAVDLSSQMIFGSVEERDAYWQRLAEEAEAEGY